MLLVCVGPNQLNDVGMCEPLQGLDFALKLPAYSGIRETAQ